MKTSLGYVLLFTLLFIGCDFNNSQERTENYYVAQQNTLFYYELFEINMDLSNRNLLLIHIIRNRALLDEERNSPFLNQADKVSKESKQIIKSINVIQNSLLKSFKELNVSIHDLSSKQNNDMLNRVLYDSKIIDSLKQDLTEFKGNLKNKVLPTHSFIADDLDAILNLGDSKDGQNLVSWEKKYFNKNQRFDGIIGNFEIMKSKVYRAENVILNYYEGKTVEVCD